MTNHATPVETYAATVLALVDTVQPNAAGWFDDRDGYIGLAVDPPQVQWFALRGGIWHHTGTSRSDLGARWVWLQPRPVDPLHPTLHDPLIDALVNTNDHNG